MTDDFSTITHGLWDDEDWAAAKTSFKAVQDAELDLLTVGTLGGWLLGDVFHLLHKAQPEQRSDVPPRAKLNAQITAELLEGQLDGLRANTVQDPLMAAVGLVQMAPVLAQLLTNAQRAQEAADEAAKAEEAVEQAQADGADDDELAALTAAAEGANQELADELAAMGPVVSTAAAAAAEAAGDKVDQLCQAADGWGVEGGDLGTDDPAGRLAMYERLAGDQLAQLAAMVGRMRIDANARVGSQWDAGPGQITDVRPSDNLSRLCGRELVNLAVPALRPLFYDRYLRRQLLTMHMEELQHEDSGSIIYIEDSSTTMKGARHLWARAVGLRLAETAAEQHRGFRAIVFSGTGSFKVFDFGDDAATATLADRLAYAEFAMEGQTDAQGPLISALTMLEDEHDRLGRTHADIVLATDGIFKLDPEFVTAFDAAKVRLDFSVYGVMIQHPVTDGMTAVCDKITSEDRLADGGNLTDLFDTITTKELVA